MNNKTELATHTASLQGTGGEGCPRKVAWDFVLIRGWVSDKNNNIIMRETK